MAASCNISATWHQLTVCAGDNSIIPSPRAGHSIVHDTISNKCIMFGGASHESGVSNETFFLDDFTLTWTKLHAEQMYLPPARYEHAAVIAQRHDSRIMLIMFGTSDENPLQDFWSLDLETLKWTCLETKGQIPSARTIHSATVSNTCGNDRVYIYGGGQSGDNPVNDDSVYYLDMNSLLWVQISSVNGPCPRLGHSLTLFNQKMYVYGGMSKDFIYDEFWEFDLKKKAWKNLTMKGDLPSARVAHTLTFIGDSYFILFGGMCRSPKLKTFDEAYLLDLTKNTWKKLESIAMPPGPPAGRLDHDACIIPRLNRDLEGISIDSKMIQNSEEVKNSLNDWCLLVFGGMSIGEVYNDLFELRID